MTEKNDVTDLQLQGLQAAVAATEFLCEITTALGLDPTKDGIDPILGRIKELIAAEGAMAAQKADCCREELE